MAFEVPLSETLIEQPVTADQAIDDEEEVGKRQTEVHKVFISYSHKDEALREELEKHLAALKREGRIETWHDRRIAARDEWRPQITSSPNSLAIRSCSELTPL